VLLVAPSAASARTSVGCSVTGAVNGVVAIQEETAIGISMGYSNTSAGTIAFTATMLANPIFGPTQRFDGASVGPGLGVNHSLAIQLWAPGLPPSPGPGDYPITINFTSNLTGNGVIGVCTFTIHLTTREPQVKVLPSITGTARTGDALTCNPGSWDREVTSATFRWLDETGAERGTAQTLTPGASLEGHRVTCTVRATNGGGSTTATSAASAVIVPPAPVNNGLPVITGIAREAEQLLCSPGTWLGSTPTFAYAWFHAGAVGGLPLETTTTYTPKLADVGTRLVCRVTATNAGGTAEATSGPTAAVVGRVPVTQTPPKISGTPNVDEDLECDPGTWSPAPTKIQFAWIRQPNLAAGDPPTPVDLKKHTETVTPGVPVKSVYHTQDDDFDHFVWCEITASNASGPGVPEHASVKVLSAGAGSQSFAMGDASVSSPRRVSAKAGRRIVFRLLARRAGTVEVVLSRWWPIARVRRVVRSDGAYELVMKLPRGLATGRRYTLTVRYRGSGRRLVTRTSSIMIVR